MCIKNQVCLFLFFWCNWDFERDCKIEEKKERKKAKIACSMLIFSLSLLTVERYNKSIWCKRSRYVSWWWSVSGPGKHNKKSSTKNRTHMYYDGAFNLFCLWIKKLEFFDRKIAPEGEKCIAIWINLVFYNTARMLNFSWKMKEKSYTTTTLLPAIAIYHFPGKKYEKHAIFWATANQQKGNEMSEKECCSFYLVRKI